MDTGIELPSPRSKSKFASSQFGFVDRLGCYLYLGDACVCIDQTGNDGKSCRAVTK